MITIMAYALVFVFMGLIMSKKLTPFAALTIVPIVFGVIGLIFKLWDVNLGEAALEGLKTTGTTAIMLLFAVLFFTLMIDAGLF